MGFEIPENPQDLDTAALDEAITAAVEESAAFADREAADLTDEELDQVEALASFVTTARGLSAERAEAAAARAERLSGALASMQAPAEEEPAEEFAAEEPAAEEAPAEEAAPAPKAPRKATAANAARKAPKVEVPEGARPTIHTAVDVPNIPMGTTFADLSAASKAIMERVDRMPKGTATSKQRNQYGALVFTRNTPAPEAPSAGWANDDEMLLAAGDESRLAGGNLVAAGGWGAPSEDLLDFCTLETADGLLDIPSIPVKRAGVNYTKGPSFADVLGSATGFIDQTEAQAEANTEKTVLSPEDPEFTEVRLEAVGVIVEAGLLLRAAWPELVRRYTEMALTAHEYKVSAKILAKIRAFTGAAVDVSGGFGNALDVLHVLDLVAQGERQRNHMAVASTLEVLLPYWVKAVIRADLANRNGVDHLAVSDAQITAFFSARNLRVQFLRGFQDLTIGEGGIATAYPETVEAIMYPAGTFVKGTKDVLTLDTVYDSVNLKKNRYLELFTEEGILVANPCGDGRRVSVPLAINGRTAANDITADLFAPATP